MSLGMKMAQMLEEQWGEEHKQMMEQLNAERQARVAAEAALEISQAARAAELEARAAELTQQLAAGMSKIFAEWQRGKK